MNQPSLSWIHHHLGVIKPYFPELTPAEPESAPDSVPDSAPEFESESESESEYSTDSRKRISNSKRQSSAHSSSETQSDRVDWRASHLPAWSGPSGFSALDYTPDRVPHRWLPLQTNAENEPASYFTALDRTPITATGYSAWSEGLYKWTIAAQEHYSFLEHLETNDLWRYKFHLWDYQYERMGIQFIAIMGQDINAGKPIEQDDESYFSEKMPIRLQRRAVVEGRGLAAHYSFGPQREGMATTDVLERYRSFAEENICTERRTR
jgi:hypothetical protein